MTLTTKTAMQEAYATATERTMAKVLETAEDWKRYNGLITTRAERLEAEQKDFGQHYAARLADAKLVILREEHGLDYDQPLPEGVSRQSSASQLDFKADARVRLDHDQRIAMIHDDHRHALSALGAEIANRRVQDRGQAHSRERTQVETHERAQDRAGAQANAQTRDLKPAWNAAIVRSGPRRS